MIFKNMTGRNQVVYKSMWGGKSFPSSIVANSSIGPTTYKFDGDPSNACELLEEIFSIKNKKLFEEKYKQAVSGNGNEARKILTLHSSSLCALLSFYNIDKENPVTINLNGENIEFNYSTFEFKNPVIGYPSNMDVVLLSTDRKRVLFLESKFSEYYISASEKSASISSQYIKNEFSNYFYDKEWLSSIGINTSSDKMHGNFELSTKNSSVNYLDGFKQMISHYVGIRRRIQGDQLPADKSVDAAKVIAVIEKPESVIYLGEILFDGFSKPTQCGNVLDPQIALKNYSKLYSELAKKMNCIIQEDNLKSKFIVLPEHMTYSSYLKKHAKNVEPRVHDFYRI